MAAQINQITDYIDAEVKLHQLRVNSIKEWLKNEDKMSLPRVRELYKEIEVKEAVIKSLIKLKTFVKLQ